MWLDEKQFEAIVAGAPLVSIDLVIRDSSKKVLLGQRTNRPAKGFWFVPGGRIMKNETIAIAYERLLNAELGIEGGSIDQAKFLGVYQHFYGDSVFGDSPPTHYVVIGFELTLSDFDMKSLPSEQHSFYKWYGEPELLTSDEVHAHTKDYFRDARNSYV
ncbi:GDP-mannose mannosyl hydrolase [Spongiibacter sp. UBA1325]|uniref:GDP-mannose mannosyl hydrolase n=1 Tax=Spongiibacter sp. UBA1325 TaxID=1947543 RepID=UPI00257B102A|nr:GDP-mannose mannosyl hydrolase [Spongiibacter sp. UBA1325]|tara:strand:+ start:20723 stop:21199 length:477 start_codon:yes stop_codon:yes gene_type:complete